MQDFLSRWLASWSGNQPQNLLGFYADKIFYSDPAHPDGIKDKSQFETYLTKLLGRYPDWHWELVSYDQLSPRRLYVKWKMTFRPGMKPVYGVDYLEMQDGLIARNEVYFDPSVFARSSRSE